MFLNPLEGLIAATLYVPKVRGYPHTDEILRLKKNGEFATEYGWVIEQVIQRKRLDWEPDVIVAVPSAESSEPRPGISAFARAIAKRVDAELVSGLTFTRKVATQHRTVDRKQRFANLRDSMKADRKLVSGKQVMIVDDVATSLATILEAARAAKAGGASSVVAAVAGRDSSLDSLAKVGVLTANG